MSEPLVKDQSSSQEKLKQQLLKNVSVDNFHSYADSYRRLAQYKEALNITSDGLNEFPLSIKLKLLKAQIYFEMSDLQNSLENYQEVIEHTQDNPHAIKAATQILIEQKQYLKAQDMLKKLKNEDADNDSWVERMQNKINLGDQDIGGIHSKTLAKLYQEQGFDQKAQAVYDEIGTQPDTDLSKLEKLKICLKRIEERRHAL